MNNGTDLEETMINSRLSWEDDLLNQERISKKVRSLMNLLKPKSPESNPSGPSVSNPAGSSVSNPSGSQVSNPSGSQVSNPSGSQVCNPSGPSTSKKIHHHVSRKTSTAGHRPTPSVATLTGPVRPASSGSQQPSPGHRPKKYEAENTDRTLYNQSVEDDVSADEEANSAYNATAWRNLTLELRDAKARNAVIKTLEDNLKPSVSSPSESSVSNLSSSSVSNPSGSSVSDPSGSFVSNPSGSSVSDPSGSFVSNPSGSSVSDPSGSFVSNPSGSSVSDPSGSFVSNPSGSSISYPSGSSESYPSGSSVSNLSGPLEVEEDVTSDEESNSEHEGFNSLDDDDKVPIGSGNTKIYKYLYRKVNWKSYTIATRTLLLAVFERRELATHSLTGKKSPAFQDKPAKMRLDRTKVDDIIWEITSKFKVERSLVRSIITTKCADECKMWKARCKNGRNVPIT